jgi:hypothetical protein
MPKATAQANASKPATADVGRIGALHSRSGKCSAGSGPSHPRPEQRLRNHHRPPDTDKSSYLNGKTPFRPQSAIAPTGNFIMGHLIAFADGS